MDDKSRQLQEVTEDLTTVIASQLDIPQENKVIATSAVGHLVKLCINIVDRHGYYATLANARDSVITAKAKAISTALSEAGDLDAPDESRRAALRKAIEYVHNPVFTSFLDELRKPSISRKKRKRASILQDDNAWWEQFSQFLSTRREEWRDKLLGKALSVSAKAMHNEEEPIAFSTLWRIATMPTHSFVDLMQLKALAGILNNNDDISVHFIPATFSFLDKTEFSHATTLKGKKRLLTELQSSIVSDGFADDTGLIAMDYPGEISFHIDNDIYEVVKDSGYEDPLEYQEINPNDPEQSETTAKKLEHKIRMYGFYLNYIGEEILDLYDDVEYSPERRNILEGGIEILRKDDGIIFKERKGLR